MAVWDRQPGESRQAYAAFQACLAHGNPDAAYRATRGVQGSHKRAPGRWRTWEDQWRWKARAAAFQAEELIQERAAKEAALAAAAEQWAARRLAQREIDYTLAARLRTQVEAMLDHPLVTTRTSESQDGQTRVTVIQPARWSYRDVAHGAEVAAKLARLACEMATEHQGVALEWPALRTTLLDALAPFPEAAQAVAAALDATGG